MAREQQNDISLIADLRSNGLGSWVIWQKNSDVGDEADSMISW